MKEPIKDSGDGSGEKMDTGCMVCGAPLVYAESESTAPCSYCGKAFSTSAVCEAGHFVCDLCHLGDGVEAIRRICLASDKTDMLDLWAELRAHRAIPVHGPEHHAIVPAVIVTTYRNLGGAATDAMIETAVKRGATIPGGFCGFMGVCGSAVGVGIAFSLLLGANPVKATERQTVLRVTNRVLAELAEYEAARCCQRDSWTALEKAVEISRELLPVALRAEGDVVCGQVKKNRECAGKICPLFPVKSDLIHRLSAGENS